MHLFLLLNSALVKYVVSPWLELKTTVNSLRMFSKNQRTLGALAAQRPQRGFEFSFVSEGLLLLTSFQP